MHSPFTRAAAVLVPLLIAILAVDTDDAHAWSPESQTFIAREAARLAPPDLYRQLVRNRRAYDMGVLEPFRTGDPMNRIKLDDGRGRLDEALELAVRQAVATIEQHRPFNEVAYRLGVVAHYVASANHPLHVAASDREHRRYAADFRQYGTSAQQRFRRVFYGFRREMRPPGARLDPTRMAIEAMARSRTLYPLIGREYRRIDFGRGADRFDDRSTAYAITALSFNHALSDIADTLRYIWLEAGGRDGRNPLPIRGLHILPLNPPERPASAGSSAAGADSARAARKQPVVLTVPSADPRAPR
ncbi:MAG: hypothetical protein AAF772_14700 [Acidobacteriota bacterium]